ncbi:hypothetical protein SIN8267_01836 [Sinobacterium norvegicum]|uniref:DM13 domain-containing protein n=1 Tax=Sinobacterium norvegicum TaxID=1641715 RepID=A0ABM9AEU9_9GAMM|nr:DM13 domain-containing protein [Sinobacterium norvegicum]CAH0991722.1 hypothetical protein SIN8267_01836 [Sinobacterium norvegicum]
MKKTTSLTLLLSHLIAIGFGFALGIYLLPIITAPTAPDNAAVAEAATARMFVGQFDRERADSDALHWGEGEVSINTATISLAGTLAPGPDYKLYLSPQFVETEADFQRLKASMVRVGDVDTFDNFIVSVPQHIDPADFNTVIIWCETFGQFITSAGYQP